MHQRITDISKGIGGGTVAVRLLIDEESVRRRELASVQVDIQSALPLVVDEDLRVEFFQDGVVGKGEGGQHSPIIELFKRQ